MVAIIIPNHATPLSPSPTHPCHTHPPTHLPNDLPLSLRLLESPGVPELKLLDGVQEGLVGGHDAGTELGADALGQTGAAEAGDELAGVLLPPLLV